MAEAGSDAPAPAADGSNGEPTQPVVASIQRQVVYTAAVTVLSLDPDGAIEALRRSVDAAGGYVSSLQGQQAVLRVPANQFESVMRDVAALGFVTDRLSPDPDGAIEALRRSVDAAGGYISSLQGQQAVLRVPADRFEAVMRDVAALGFVTDRQISANDVTAELVDLEIRIDNLEALRGRMKGLARQRPRGWKTPCGSRRSWRGLPARSS